MTSLVQDMRQEALRITQKRRNRMLQRAADRIEELEKENNRLKLELAGAITLGFPETEKQQ